MGCDIHGLLEVRKNGKWEKLDYIIVEPLADVFNKRLKEKGLPRRKGAQAGDLIVKVEVVVPEKLSDRERELFEALAKESSFNPRG